jgi:hypothetical protein
MSASEPEQAELVHGERRIAITNSCVAAVSAIARIRDIIKRTYSLIKKLLCVEDQKFSNKITVALKIFE